MRHTTGGRHPLSLWCPVPKVTGGASLRDPDQRVPSSIQPKLWRGMRDCMVIS